MSRVNVANFRHPDGTADNISLDNSGQVGIGTSSPDSILDLEGAAPTITLNDTNGTDDRATLQSTGGALILTARDGTADGEIIFKKFDGTTTDETARITNTGNLQFDSGYGSVATAYGVRAWANLDGTGTPATRQAGNISTIGDNGNGDYTFNFTTAMPDSNYAVVAMPSHTSSVNNYAAAEKSDSRTSSAFRIQQWNGSNIYDLTICNVAVFR